MVDLSDDQIRELCLAMDTRSSVDCDRAWGQLRHLGTAVVPYLTDAYHEMSKWQGRVACVFHLIRYGRSHDEAFQLGIEALNDRATLVRYRACMLLAGAQRTDALPHLQKLLAHADHKTADDAAAAIDAIENQNPNWFLDRDHSDKVFWFAGSVDECVEFVTKPRRPWWKIW